MKTSIFFTVLFVSFWASSTSAEIYSYVDKNGKTQYTNVAPPQSARTVQKSKEISVTKDILQERIEQKNAETDESYEQKQERQRQAARTAQREREEQDRINRQIQEEERERKTKIREEKKYILSKDKNWLSKCDSMKTGYLIVQKCRDMVKKRTKQDLRRLTKSTEHYFTHKYSNRGDTDRYFEEMYESLLENYEVKSTKKKRHYK